MALICIWERPHWSKLADRIISMPLSNVVGTTIVGTCRLETAADQCNSSFLYPNSLGIRRELFGISCVCTTIQCPLFWTSLSLLQVSVCSSKRSDLTSFSMRGKGRLTCQSIHLGSLHNVVSLLAVVVLQTSSLHNVVSSLTVVLSSLLVARPLFLCTMSLFFALCRRADNLLRSSAVGPCLLCTMSFFLHSMSLFLCSMSPAGGSLHFLVLSLH